MGATAAMKESNVDVLVIGAGPSGLMASIAFARAGINFRVVDKRPKKVAMGHADGIQPRTIEVFQEYPCQSYGLAERLLREGNQMHTAAFYNPRPKGGIASVGRVPDVTAPTARYPFEVTLHQGAIEAIFHDSLLECGAGIDRQVELSEIKLDERNEILSSSDSYPVTVTLRHTDESNEIEVVHAKYAIGADGAHSLVRKRLEFTMDGERTDYVWGVLDTIPVTDFPDIRNRCVIHSDDGSCMIIPREGDVVRFYIQLSDEDAREVINAKGRIDVTGWNPWLLQQTLKQRLRPFTIDFPNEAKWWTLYIIGQRFASNFSKKERIFIVGDACHTHSPKAGQGMNASMNDSHNLAWKITHVLRGWADPLILKTYEYERRKYAKDLIDFDRKFSSLFSGKPRTDANQNGVSHEEFLEAFQTFGGFTSGIGIQYRVSPITNNAFQALANSLVIGTRMVPQIILRAADFRPIDIQDLLPSDTRFKIIIFPGNIDEPERRAGLEMFAQEMTLKERFLKKYGQRGSKEGWSTVFDIVTVLAGKKETVNCLDVPAVLRPHWTKVYLDDVGNTGNMGGKAYTSYGIPPEGAVFVVRPDGYVGHAAPLNNINALDEYFAGFMKVAL